MSEVDLNDGVLGQVANYNGGNGCQVDGDDAEVCLLSHNTYDFSTVFKAKL